MNWMRDLPHDDIEAIKAETRGEIVRWAGKPDARRAFLYSFSVYAMGIPWSALSFSIFGVLIAAVFSGKMPDRAIPAWEYALMAAAILFTFAFVAMGIAMLATPFWVRAKARRTVHAVTDKRVVTIINGKTREVSSIDRARILKLVRSEKRDGSGTLRIVSGFKKDSDGDMHEDAVELFGIKDVKAAESAVAEMREARRG